MFVMSLNLPQFDDVQSSGLPDLSLSLIDPVSRRTGLRLGPLRMSDRGAAAHRRARSVEELVRFRFPAVGPSALTGAEDVGSTGIFPAAAATEGAKIGAAMPLHNPLLHQDLLDQGMSAAAQRAGQVLAKLSEVELLAVLGVELQRRGLQQLGELPKPRAKVVKRRTPEREQMLLLLPVHDGMSNL